jgi:Ca-activated chloride channel family protein
LRQTIKNTGPAPLEIDYLTPLPQEGQVLGLTLLADGQELTGQVYDKEKAFEIYRQIVSQLKDPALMEYAGRGLVRARIFPIPAGQSRTLELSLKYLLPKDADLITLAFPLDGPLTAGKTVGSQDIRVEIVKTPNLTNVYSPVAEVETSLGTDQAKATFSAKTSPALSNFLLYLKTAKTPMGGLVLSNQPEPDEDGFFLFLAEPAITTDSTSKAQSKNVIFALDTSGSMNGRKFKQAVAALEFVLERLNPDDTFNLVEFNTLVSSWRPEPAKMTPVNRQEALKYLRNLRAQGSTNIEKALETSLKMVESAKPSYLLFLTDGEATAGQTEELPLASLAEKNNPQRARIFSFGVGDDVNSRLLDRFSTGSGGYTIYVKPEENIEEKVGTFFNKLTSPVMTKPVLTASLPVNRLIPQDMPDIFQGSQAIMVGRYPKGGAATFKLTGLIDGKPVTFEYPVSLAEGPQPDRDFLPQLWAQRRVGAIIDYIDLNSQVKDPASTQWVKEYQELANELLSLSKKYGILTPYTSFLALEKTDLTAQVANTQTATRNLKIIEETTGSSANAQRGLKQDFLASPTAKPAPRSPVEAKAKLEAMAALDMEASHAEPSELNPPRQLGGKTFFLKDGQWRDSELTEEDLKNAQVITQLSDEYFTLAKELAPERQSWLSQAEPVVFKQGQKVYLIEPVAK